MEATIASSSLLNNDLVEEIFLQLPVKSLIRFKSLSKQWRSTIKSRCFVERQLKIAKQSHVDHPKVIAISEVHGNGRRSDTDICFETICLESASIMSSTLVNFPRGFHHWIYVSESCDGLFCIHSPRTQSVYVVNPATQWLRQLPPARFQILMHKLISNHLEAWDPFLKMCMISVRDLAFVKATDYKLVWLYNSDEYNSDASSPNDGLTKCEVFDFRANAWRYLTCTPSYLIFDNQMPVSANGSVYWFTEPYNDETKVVAFNIYTETFRMLPLINPVIAGSDPKYINMCTLDNCLCMSKRERDTMIEDIWRLKSSEDTWEKIYTIDWLSCSSSLSQIHDISNWTLVAICKDKKMLFSLRYGSNMVKYDPQTKSLSSIFQQTCKRYVPYFQSLISHI